MITLKKAKTAREVEDILLDPELFVRIAEDGHDSDNYIVPFDDCQRYMMILLDGEAIGVWNLYPLNTVTLNIHCNILKEHRAHGKEAARLMVNWLVYDAPEQYQKLNAEIPVIYPDVYWFTKKFGMSDEGINRRSIMKNGEIVDQYRLGATRHELRRFLEKSCQK